MTERLLVIFLVSIFWSDLAYSIPKLEQKDHSEPINEDDMLSYHNVVESEEPVTSAVEYSDSDYSHDEKPQLNTRSMQVGDTFTTQEMLPIAKKLMKKIGNRRGKGKGVITSATCPKTLADNLFERFFVSMKRIVILKDVDIAGLDALQALALSGEVTGSRSAVNSVTKWRVNGETLFDGKPITKCHFKLLKKRIDRKGRIAVSKRKVKRRREDVSKKLAKHRKLVMNPAKTRPTRKYKNRISQQINQNKRKGLQSLKELNATTNTRGASNAEDVCRWRYECTDPARLEACGLHTDCSKDSALYMGLKLNPDELTGAFKQFRRMVGVDVLDEEVEKILEKRYLLLRPQKFEPSGRVESIADYFNKIMIREQLDAHQTSPTPTHAAQNQQEAYDEFDATPGPPQDEAKENEILAKKDDQPAEEDKLMSEEGKESAEKYDQPAEKNKEPAEEDEEPAEKDDPLPGEDEEPAEEDEQLPEDEQLAEEDVQDEADQPNEEEFTAEPAPDESTETNNLEAKRSRE